MANSPLRTCIVCRQKGEKSIFLRINRSADGEIVLDTTYRVDGRGCYICKNKTCIEKAIKKKVVCKAIKAPENPRIYEELKLFYERLQEN